MAKQKTDVKEPEVQAEEVQQEPTEVEQLKAQLDAAQKALIPFQDENVKLKDELKQVRAELAAAKTAKVQDKPEQLKGTYAVVDGKREELHLSPRPFRDLIPDWRGRQFNDGCLTLVLERHG